MSSRIEIFVEEEKGGNDEIPPMLRVRCFGNSEVIHALCIC